MFPKKLGPKKFKSKMFWSKKRFCQFFFVLPTRISARPRAYKIWFIGNKNPLNEIIRANFWL